MQPARVRMWTMAALAVVAFGAELLAQRAIERPLMPTTDGFPDVIVIPQPVVSDALMWRISATGRTPSGFEGYPGPIHQRPSAARRMPIQGMTVGDALQMLMASDARYSWNESERVVVVRPVSAWSDRRNPLNQPIGHIDWKDVAPEDALTRVFELIYGLPHSAAPPMGNASDRRVSIRIDSGTVIDVLNALVRNNGGTAWSAAYPEDEPGIRFRLNLATFSGAGHGHASPRLPPSMAQAGLRRIPTP